MRLGMMLRNSSRAASAELIGGCARAAEALGLDHVWTVDHIAIPPDDCEPSGGVYFDPLATLAYVAGCTRRIGLGVAVLVIPYRPALATAKWVATIQALAGNRLTLGVGAGWMEAEFRAVGVPHAQRGRVTDDTLAFFHDCFANDVVTVHGQPLVFKPRPPRPPIFVGGHGPHVVRRVVRYGDGWIPLTADLEKLRPALVELRDACAAAGKPAPAVMPLGKLALEDSGRAAAELAALAEIGVTDFLLGERCDTVGAFTDTAQRLLTARQQAGV